MIDETLVDTDILLKVISYRLAQASLAELTRRGMPAKVLGAARFMLATHVAKGRRIHDAAAAEAELVAIGPALIDVEPSTDETRVAAEIEALAQSLGVPVDGGESLLLAMLMARSTRVMLSGDKRAITAIASMLSPLPPNRIACLEQLLGCLVDVLGPEAVRSAICAEQAVDKALTSVCGCSSSGVDPRPGLASYIEHLRAQAPALLHAGVSLPG